MSGPKSEFPGKMYPTLTVLVVTSSKFTLVLAAVISNEKPAIVTAERAGVGQRHIKAVARRPGDERVSRDPHDHLRMNRGRAATRAPQGPVQGPP